MINAVPLRAPRTTPVSATVLCRFAYLRTVPRHTRCAVASHGAELASKEEETERQWSMLKDFTRKQFRGMADVYVANKEQRGLLRDALMTVYSTPNVGSAWNPTAPDVMVLMGIMASDVRLAVRGLRDWCDALGLEYVAPEVKVPGASSLAEVQGNVYIKYNSKSKVCYISPYLGKERGVLVQLGQEQLGHFPLGMWDESQSRPPPNMS